MAFKGEITPRRLLAAAENQTIKARSDIAAGLPLVAAARDLVAHALYVADWVANPAARRSKLVTTPVTVKLPSSV